ncbi:MAG: sugar phosphate isomerase/epimerase [Planctomycetes bacterium]|nr:sugar phosphate isomerase/epimerase [Planctomycetota bacterium]
MTDLSQFGVQSYCFRGFNENDKVAALVKEIGLSRIELCAVHAEFNDPEAFKAVATTYADAGVEIVSLGVQTFTGDEETERKWFECADIAGAKFISAHFRIDNYQDAVPVAMKLCKEFGVKLAIHCHGGYMFGGSKDVLQHLLSISDDSIGICLDTAWCLQSGGDPVEWAELFADRLYGVHYKDFEFDKAGKWTDVVIGEGALDAPGLLAVMQKNNFAGYAVLEYEGDVDNPTPALKSCVESVQRVCCPSA